LPRETYILKKRPDGEHELVPRDQVQAWTESHYPDRSMGMVIKLRAVERGSWVWRNGHLVDRLHAGSVQSKRRSGYIIKDIEPYKNVAIDGKVIGGRRQHRDMLRAHGCVEVGNDPAATKVARPTYWDNNGPAQKQIVERLKHVMGKL
jgi:hypothetical protein